MELDKVAQKYRNYDRFYNMEDIEKKRDEARSKLRIIEKHKKRKGKECYKLTWQLARVCKEIIGEHK